MMMIPLWDSMSIDGSLSFYLNLCFTHIVSQPQTKISDILRDTNIVSEYDQEISQSQTADKPMAS